MLYVKKLSANGVVSMIVNIVTGFLGSGKTSLIRHLAGKLLPEGEVAVLVGEFSEVSIDGTILSKEVPNVLETGSECIYCTLSADMARQISFAEKTFSPQRLLVEYPGVVAVQGLLAALRVNGAHFSKGQLHVTYVIDGPSFESLYAQSPHFVHSQICRADTLVLNKCDLLGGREASDLAERLRRLNPRARLVLTSFGQVSLKDLRPKRRKVSVADDTPLICAGPQYANDIPTYISFSRRFRGVFARNLLQEFFEGLPHGHVGQVARAKGIFYCDEGWVRLDYLPPRVTLEPLKGGFGESRVVVIGSTLAAGRMVAALQGCMKERIKAGLYVEEREPLCQSGPACKG